MNRRRMLFIEEEPTPILPNEYQEVEYLQTSGSAYFNSGLKVTPTTSVKMRLMLDSNSLQQRFFGVQNHGLIYCVYLNGSEKMGIAYQDDEGQWTSTSSSISTNTIYEFELDGYNKVANHYDENGNLLGTKDLSSYTATKESDFNLVLLGTYTPDYQYTRTTKGKLYKVEIKENNIKVRDFVCCYRRSDGKPGLYDLVNDEFYISVGTGEFDIGPDVNTLPNEFQRVEYLQSNNGQYIDTGIIGNQYTKIDIDFKYNQYTNNWRSVIGGRNGSYNWITISQATNNRNIRCDYGAGTASTGTVYSNITYNDFTKHNITMYNFKVYQDGALVGTVSTKTAFTTTYAITLFALRTSSTNVGTYAYANIYNCRIYDNKYVLRSFTPCYRKLDNVAGMYDAVSQTFFTNLGSGNFTLGPDVN